MSVASFARSRAAVLTVFAVTFVVYLASPFHLQTDSQWSIPIALSVLQRGDANLDEYPETLARSPHGTHHVDGHAYGDFPLAVSIAAVPFVAAWDAVLHGWKRLVDPTAHPHRAAWLESADRPLHSTDVELWRFANIEHGIASFFTAAAIAVLFAAFRTRIGVGPALAAATAIAFGTSAWTTASRVLWQHGPSMLAVALCVLLLTRERIERFGAFALGLAAACAFTLRPTNGIAALAISVFLLLRHRRAVVPFALGAVLVAIPFCAYNLSIWGSLLPPYFRPARLEPGASTFWEALVGNVISPSRGLLVFSPFLAFAALEVVRRFRSRQAQPVEWLFAGIVVCHWLAISSFPHWWGGHCIGPRFFTDVLPFFGWLIALAFGRWFETRRETRFRGRVVTALAAIAIAWSLFVHGRGATSVDLHDWNFGPPNVDDAPSRLWDWWDPQALRAFHPRPHP